MIDIKKQILYWQNGSYEDWEVALELFKRQRIRHSLFFAHLSLEKMLKAILCRKTNDLAPPIHNLVRLADLGRVILNEEQRDLFADVNEFNIEGRYPEMLTPPPLEDEASEYLKKIEEALQWLKNQLNQ